MKAIIRLTAIASAAAGVLALSGCSALNVGEEHFSCDGMPGSVYCHSARDVYEKTNDGVVPSPVGRAEGAYNKDCKDCIRAEDVNPALRVEEDEQSQWAVTPDGKRLRVVEGRVQTTSEGRRIVVSGGINDEVINNYVSPALPDNPVPIRTPAQVMRIWVGPYVDTMGDLIAPGFVYTEVEPRRWIYPGDEGQGNRAFNPLKGEPNAGNLATGNAYSNPSSYSNPEATPFNALERFRRDRQAEPNYQRY
ncbi:MAG: type IV conjugative transfer system lipoprotein TraV [Oscillospiraceae bacterium]|nr:type IV conjugative transfer system lipoprotein TraV [Oscillospiraceae bacterium]